MSFLVRFVVTDEYGVVHDETMVSEIDTLFSLEKGMTVEGRPLTMRMEFDPPLAPAARYVT